MTAIDFTAFVDELAAISGETIRPFFRSALGIENKSRSGGFDPVTAADRAAEAAMRTLIKRTFPEHGIIGEEFGFLGTMLLLMLFAAVIWYGIQIAMTARSQFGRLLAMGVTVNFFLYIMINALMVMGLIPVVGIPMPLISYGGTAMMTVMFGFGLLMSVHVHRHVTVPRHSSGMI